MFAPKWDQVGIEIDQIMEGNSHKPSGEKADYVWAINKAIYAEDIMKVANARAIKKADYVGPSRRRPGGLCWGHNEGGQCQGHHEDGLCWTIKNAVYKGNI